MPRRIATVALMLAWLCANGALWDAMQVAAWGKMFAGYTESMSVKAALRETFDPAKPCDMCVGIAHAKTATQKNLPGAESQAAAKFVLAMDVVDTPVFSNERGDWSQAVTIAVSERTDPVPVPPPRV